MNEETDNRPWNYYKKAVAGSWLRLLLISFLFSLAAYAATQRMAPAYQVNYSYLIALGSREEANEYRFDGYYAISATDLFAQTLAAWIKAPETIVAAYEAAGLPLPSRDQSQLVKSVEAVRQAPQFVSVTVRGANAQSIRQLANGLRTVTQKNVDRYHDEGVPVLQFKVIASEPWLGEKKVSTVVIVSAVFIFTWFIGLNLVILAASLKKS